MSKKLSGNGLWESSRMMLPEHKEQLLQFRRDVKRRVRPMMDEQAVELVARQVAEALALERAVKLTVYDPFAAAVTIEGWIGKVDEQGGRLQIVGNDHVTWVPWTDIVEVEVEGAGEGGK